MASAETDSTHLTLPVGDAFRPVSFSPHLSYRCCSAAMPRAARAGQATKEVGAECSNKSGEGRRAVTSPVEEQGCGVWVRIFARDGDQGEKESSGQPASMQ